MSLAGLLYQRATIERPVEPIATDRVNAPRPAYEAVATDEPCRLVEDAEELVLSSTAAGIVATRFSVRFGSATDVRPRDKITLLTDHLDRRSTQIFRVLTVRQALGRRGVHHLVAYVQSLGA